MLSGFSLWCPQSTPPNPDFTTREQIEAAWFKLATELGEESADAFSALSRRTGGLVFPDHLVGVLGEMRHPMHGFDAEAYDDDDGDDFDFGDPPEPEDNTLFESLAYVYVTGKRRGWTL